VQKHIEGDRVAGVSLHSIEWSASSYYDIYRIMRIRLFHWRTNILQRNGSHDRISYRKKTTNCYFHIESLWIITIPGV